MCSLAIVAVVLYLDSAILSLSLSPSPSISLAALKWLLQISKLLARSSDQMKIRRDLKSLDKCPQILDVSCPDTILYSLQTPPLVKPSISQDIGIRRNCLGGEEGGVFSLELPLDLLGSSSF